MLPRLIILLDFRVGGHELLIKARILGTFRISVALDKCGGRLAYSYLTCGIAKYAMKKVLLTQWL